MVVKSFTICTGVLLAVCLKFFTSISIPVEPLSYDISMALLALAFPAQQYFSAQSVVKLLNIKLLELFYVSSTIFLPANFAILV